jgi:tetratricopeptide (TPR) repeat protein
MTVIPPAAQEKAEAAKGAVERRQYAEAESIIGEASTPDEHYWLGRAQVELKTFDEADLHFQAIVAGNHTSSQAYEGLARTAIGRKNYNLALEQAAKAIELDGNNAEAYQVQGTAHAFRQDFKSAVASLERAVEIDPSNAYAHYQLGLSQYRLKRFDRTVIHFEKFLELAPNAPEAGQVRSLLRTVRG